MIHNGAEKMSRMKIRDFLLKGLIWLPSTSSGILRSYAAAS